MAEALIVLIALIVGVIGGAGATYRVLRNRMNIDYKERWQSLVKVLSDEGRLTDEQVARLLGEEKPAVSSDIPQEQLRKMTSRDRARVAVNRAICGHPPNDDLVGMTSRDMARVIEARQQNASRQKKS